MLRKRFSNPPNKKRAPLPRAAIVLPEFVDGRMAPKRKANSAPHSLYRVPLSARFLSAPIMSMGRRLLAGDVFAIRATASAPKDNDRIEKACQHSAMKKFLKKTNCLDE